MSSCSLRRHGTYRIFATTAGYRRGAGIRTQSAPGQGNETGEVVAAGPTYVVVQVILKEKLWGTGSGNLTDLEKALNAQAA
jgi:hypothetical protein